MAGNTPAANKHNRPSMHATRAPPHAGASAQQYKLMGQQSSDVVPQDSLDVTSLATSLSGDGVLACSFSLESSGHANLSNPALNVIAAGGNVAASGALLMHLWEASGVLDLSAVGSTAAPAAASSGASSEDDDEDIKEKEEEQEGNEEEDEGEGDDHSGDYDEDAETDAASDDVDDADGVGSTTEPGVPASATQTSASRVSSGA